MVVLRLALCLFCAASMAAAQEGNSPLQAHLAAAREAQAHTNCHLAAQEYHAAARLLPTSGELRANEGIALYCDQQLGLAVSTLHTALQLNPALTIPHLFLGLAAYRMGDLAAADQELRGYLKQAPNDATAHLWLGYTLAAAGEPAKAEAEFAQVLAADPKNPDAEYATGEAALAIAHQKAIALQALDPSGAKLLQLAAARYRTAGDAKRADAALEESAKRQAGAPPRDSVTTQKIDTLFHEAQDAKSEAQTAFATILALAPDSYRAHEVIGDALLAAQQQDAAIAQYDEVIRLNPTLPGVHETLSQCLMATGHFAEALDALHAESRLSPVFSSRLLTRIGQVQLAMGDETGAVQSLESAVKDAAAPPLAHLLLGQALLRQGHAAEAIPQLRRYLASDPNGATAYYYLSRAYRVLGDRTAMAQALESYRRTSEDAKQRTLVSAVTHGETASFFSDDASGPDLPDAAGNTPPRDAGSTKN